MLITLDTELCTRYNLMLEEALLLTSIMNPTNNNQKAQILKLSALSPLSVEKVEKVCEGIKKREAKEDQKNVWAEEFFKAFPHKCIRPDGSTGYLKQGVLKRGFFREYKKLIKSEEDHRRAMEYMIDDVKRRERGNSLGWMKSILKYIADEPWESKDEVKFVPYGGDML